MESLSGYTTRMDSPRVPALIIGGPRVDAALKFAAGADPSGDLGTSLRYLCEVLSSLCNAPVASVYVLEGKDDLVLRGNFGFPARAIGEVRLTVGQGITGTAVETLRPVSVDDAGLTAQFAYFPQLAEERYPAFLAVPLLDGARPRGALVLQREQGPFTEADVLLALSCARTLAALLDGEHTQGAQSQLTARAMAAGARWEWCACCPARSPAVKGARGSMPRAAPPRSKKWSPTLPPNGTSCAS
jgi:GAF domain-containing protein